MFWTALALWTRLRLWMVTASAGRWERAFAARTLEAMEAVTPKKPGNGRTLTTAFEDAERARAVAKLLDRRDDAQTKWVRREGRADRLRRRLRAATKPRTLAGAVAGAMLLTTGAMVAHANGVDVAALLAGLTDAVARAAEAVASLTS